MIFQDTYSTRRVDHDIEKINTMKEIEIIQGELLKKKASLRAIK